MITEFLGGAVITLIGIKVYIIKFRPKHLEFDGVSTWEHSSFDGMKNSMKASRDGLKIYSEPFVELFGIPLMYNHSITDPDLVRSFFNSDQAQGHLEMAGFWELMAHYRELTNQKGAFKISENELGLMRDLDPKNQKDTVVMKLARKRFLEFTSSQKQFPANLERVIKESEDLVEEVLKQSENGTKSIDPQVLAMDAATNTGFALAVGYSFKQGTKGCRQAAEWIQNCLSELVGPHSHKLIFMLIPRCIRKFIPLKYWPPMCEKIGDFYDSLFDCIDRHEENYNEDDDPVCLLDTVRQDYVQGKFTYSDIFHTVQAMLIAAADTTSVDTALVWSNLARFPEWQKTLRDEIENINLGSIQKWEHLPKTAAFMFETMRWTPSLHRSLFHSATSKLEIGGYSFGKDSLFSFSIAGIAMDPKYFPEPFKFDPTRFLTEDGCLKRNKNLMPFGFGKRSCPGQAIAELQMLLFTVHLLRKCDVEMDPQNPLLNPTNEKEWFNLFSRRPTYKFQGGFMVVENCNIVVKERKN